MKEEIYLNNIFKDIDKTIILDEEQKKAIREDSNYVLLIAGAGSGKTTTMAAKVKYLVDIKNIKPEEILVISFTNQATKELQERIQIQFHIPCTICTFHKLGYDILKKVGFSKYRVLEDNKQIISQYFEDKIKHQKEIVTFFTNHFSNQNTKKWINFCSDFLKCWKTKGYSSLDFPKVSKQYSNREIVTFLSIMENICQYYEKEMKRHKWIDFDDMILLAMKSLHKITLPYRYIMVDEYQDISPVRFALIQKILKQNKAKLIAVGDDFQSIFAFAGSDISLFSDFQKTLGGVVLPITHTYRNSQELIDIAGSFVMENQKQYVKQLKSAKHKTQPIIIKVYDDRFSSNKHLLKSVKDCLEDIYNSYSFAKVAILGRYQFEKSILLQDHDFSEDHGILTYKVHPTLEVTFFTVHASKGLGFDEVILFNGKEDIFGFPSKIKDDILMTPIREEDDSILLAEERRLFYVALTRTKNRVYILTPAYHPSLFVREIMNNIEVKIEDKQQILTYKKRRICPNCGHRLRKRYHPSIYPFYVCTNSNICHFKTNSLYYRFPIILCPQCQKGNIIAVKENKQYYLQCTYCKYRKK